MKWIPICITLSFSIGPALAWADDNGTSSDATGEAGSHAGLLGAQAEAQQRAAAKRARRERPRSDDWMADNSTHRITAPPDMYARGPIISTIDVPETVREGERDSSGKHAQRRKSRPSRRGKSRWGKKSGRSREVTGILIIGYSTGSKF